jgi:2-polyprenyl-3-methyl-5-hydroxy-6-metoxy-1,4-benzoquinol methylase
VKQIGGDLISRDVDSDWQISSQGRFDLIIFRHVLEHLLDPLTALKKVQQALAPEGYVYIAVPDMMHPDGSLADFWYRCVHTYYYSEITLSRIAAMAGLKPVVIRSENSELWGIFQQSETDPKPTDVSVYLEQIQTVQQYKRRRLIRRFLLVFSPEKISQWIPKSLKNLIPKQFKQRFRQLVYRH